MSAVPPRRTAAIPGWTLAVALAALLALRLAHLGGPLDDPHSWRQCDTFEATRAFWRGGVDLLHPSVAWLGAHRTLIFEFPLPEALAALVDRVTGLTPVADRVVTLAFFLLALWTLHRLARELAGPRAAWAAALAYAASPLAVYYSRAATVDFAAQACAQGFLLFALRAARGGPRLAPAALAAVCGALAAMIKGPYLGPVLVPLALAALAADAAGRWAAGAATAVAAAAFVAWRRQVNLVNAAAPDWTWLPGYYKEVNPWWWYVGSLHQRLAVGEWVKLGKRLVFEVASPAGAVLAACGLGGPGGDAAVARRGPNPVAFALAWLAGAGAYLLVFFPLNVLHNYYQVPFVAPLALLAGCGFAALERSPRALPRDAAALLLAGTVLAAFVAPRAFGWYRVDWLRVEAGRAIAAHTPPGALVVAVDHGSGYSDPRLLTRADRRGWSVAAGDANPALLARLAGEGARWLAWVSEPGAPQLAPPAFLAARERARVPLAHAGATLGTLHLFALAPAAGSP